MTCSEPSISYIIIESITDSKSIYIRMYDKSKYVIYIYNITED